MHESVLRHARRVATAPTTPCICVCRRQLCIVIQVTIQVARVDKGSGL